MFILSDLFFIHTYREFLMGKYPFRICFNESKAKQQAEKKTNLNNLQSNILHIQIFLHLNITEIHISQIFWSLFFEMP